MAKLQSIVDIAKMENKSIMEEVCCILPPNLDYTVIHSKNPSYISQKIKELKADKSIINLEEFILLGDIDVYPYVNLKCDLVCVYMRVTRYTTNFSVENLLFLFEKDSRIK